MAKIEGEGKEDAAVIVVLNRRAKAQESLYNCVQSRDCANSEDRSKVPRASVNRHLGEDQSKSLKQQEALSKHPQSAITVKPSIARVLLPQRFRSKSPACPLQLRNSTLPGLKPGQRIALHRSTLMPSTLLSEPP